MPSNWSLVIFTLTVQSAVGSVWCVRAALFGNGGRAELPDLKFQILAALCLVMAWLAAAMSHLGNPGGTALIFLGFAVLLGGWFAPWF